MSLLQCEGSIVMIGLNTIKEFNHQGPLIFGFKHSVYTRNQFLWYLKLAVEF